MSVSQVGLHFLDLLHGSLACLRIIFIRFNCCHLSSIDGLNLLEIGRTGLGGVSDLHISLLGLG
jgi:hypothetical protein